MRMMYYYFLDDYKVLLAMVIKLFSGFVILSRIKMNWDKSIILLLDTPITSNKIFLKLLEAGKGFIFMNFNFLGTNEL